MQSKYKWASNPSKEERAIKEIVASGAKFKDEKEKEEAVKTVYKRMMGHIVGEPASGAVAKGGEDINKLLADAKEEGRKEAEAELAKGGEDKKKDAKK